MALTRSIFSCTGNRSRATQGEVIPSGRHGHRALSTTEAEYHRAGIRGVPESPTYPVAGAASEGHGAQYRAGRCQDGERCKPRPFCQRVRPSPKSTSKSTVRGPGCWAQWRSGQAGFSSLLGCFCAPGGKRQGVPRIMAGCQGKEPGVPATRFHPFRRLCYSSERAQRHHSLIGAPQPTLQPSTPANLAKTFARLAPRISCRLPTQRY
jgi:hypothetical protein